MSAPRTRPRAWAPALPRLLPALLGLALLPACGGSAPDGAAATPADTADGRVRPSERADSAAPLDTAAVPDGAAAADSVPTGAGAVSAPFSLEPKERGDGGRVATLAQVRTARHDGYDRFVVEFADRVPGWSVRYAAATPTQCGSGRPVSLETDQALEVDIRPAAAHDDAGRATVEPRSIEPRLALLRSARLTCDFEGVVEWVLGLEARRPFRVFTLEHPPRLVVDLQH